MSPFSKVIEALSINPFRLIFGEGIIEGMSQLIG